MAIDQPTEVSLKCGRTKGIDWTLIVNRAFGRVDQENNPVQAKAAGSLNPQWRYCRVGRDIQRANRAPFAVAGHSKAELLKPGILVGHALGGGPRHPMNRIVANATDQRTQSTAGFQIP